jgi:hypothetical protein
MREHEFLPARGDVTSFFPRKSWPPTSIAKTAGVSRRRLISPNATAPQRNSTHLQPFGYFVA